MKAVEVKALNEYKIRVAFDDGVSGIVDLNDLIKKGIFQVLQDERIFQKIYVTGAAIAWSEELEIDAGSIYAEILNQPASQLLHKPLYNAAD